jgi:hypothetical protein
MTKSKKLISALISAGVIQDKHCEQKALIIARHHLSQSFKDGVEMTEIAKNKKQYKQPIYED